jgi:hypothetical protein
MSVFELSRQHFCDFLMLAKKNTFADATAQRAQSKCLLSKNYIYEAGDFRYEDQYFGEYIDVGEEIVWYRDVPIWGMGYRGGIHSDFMDQRDEAFDFLREALKIPEPDFPVRGPKYFENDIYNYHNYPEGNIMGFMGQELICRGSTEICFRRYVGGVIYGKNNPNMVFV